MVALYGTGEVQTNPPGIDGQLAGDLLTKPVFPCNRYTIYGKDAQVLYAGAAWGTVADVLEVEVQLPDGIGSGPFKWF
jgi:uncharacterized protein (TIGR03437 family)